MSVLALDLGTKTGYAFTSGGRIDSGTWQLTTPAKGRSKDADYDDRDMDPRFAELWTKLSSVFNHCAYRKSPLTHIFFEDVEFLSYQKQAQLWGGFRAVVMAFASLCTPSLLTRGVAVGTLKKFATGSGAAKKEHMKMALQRQGKWNPKMDDNCVDAVHLLNFAIRELKS